VYNYDDTKEVHKMRTTLNLSQELLFEVKELYKGKTISKAVEVALRETVRRKKIELLLSLPGKIEVEDITEELENAEIGEFKRDRCNN